MAIGLCDDGNDDGGGDPLIRELDLDDLASQTSADLLEPSQRRHLLGPSNSS